MLQHAIWNYQNKGNLSKEIKAIKKNQIKIIELKL